ncbi:unnamed protein product [Prorocentrum cordatum]|uniref:Altered inheritance of mitochondria protein 24, mitochondrial n=1 Tax=Prorocentrum cordatum TaxID=2364126 RepID=A0ABN9U9B6_9DINO|nr:unnamed protein product [Polarella glacialis]
MASRDIWSGIVGGPELNLDECKDGRPASRPPRAHAVAAVRIWRRVLQHAKEVASLTVEWPGPTSLEVQGSRGQLDGSLCPAMDTASNIARKTANVAQLFIVEFGRRLRRDLPASAVCAMARSSRGGGSGSRRSKTYWMWSCGGSNWDWRATCFGCGYTAPPWALEAAAKAKPQADKDGWVDQPRGRWATSAATSQSQTSASGASGTPSGSGATAIERLQVAAEQLEALQARPPDGVDCCFADVVASQLEAKRAELAEAQRAAAEQKASSMPLSAMLHKEANVIGKAQLQKAQEEPAQLDAEVEEASRALHVLEDEARVESAAQLRQRAAEWAGASQVPGPLMQLGKLPEAWGSSNYEVAWAAIRSQVEAVRAQLAEAPAAPKREPWAESRPVDEISSEGGDRAGGCRPWQPQCAAERGQAERRGDARGEWPKVAQARKRELAAEAEVSPAPGQVVTAAQDVRCGLEELGFNGNGWGRILEVIAALDSRNRAPPHPVMPQEACLAPHRLEVAREACLAPRVCAHGQGGPAGELSLRSGLEVLIGRSRSVHYVRAAAAGSNLDILATFGDTVLLQQPRFIAVVGLAAESLSANVSVMAGRACAATVAELPALAALRAAPAGAWPPGVARSVVGDFALQAVGAEQLVAAQLGSAGLEAARRLRVQRLPSGAAETAFLASSPSPGRQLGVHWGPQGWTFRKASQSRKLATVAASARGGVHEGRVRAAGAPRRARRLGPIRKAWPATSMACARAGTGNADGNVHCWRLAACRSARAPPMGAERELRARRAELRRRSGLDPAALAAGHAVQMLGGQLETGELPHGMQEWGLEAAATRHASAGTPWEHCASSFEAAVPTRARIGWIFQSERCMVTSLGDVLDLIHLGAWSASVRRETPQLSHDTRLQRPMHWGAIGRQLGPDCGPRVWGQNGLEAFISIAHWKQASVQCEFAGDEFGRCWLPAPEPPQRRHTDVMWAQWACKPAEEKLNGKLCLDGSALEPQFCAVRWESWAMAQRDDYGNLGTRVYGTVRRSGPQQTAKGGEDFATWRLATFAGPAAQAVLDGRLAEAQRRGTERADRLAEMGAQMHAVDSRQAAGERHARTEVARELGRGIWRAAILGHGVEARDREELPPAAERHQVHAADAEEPQAAGEATGEEPMARRPRLESARSTGSSSAALSASAVAFSILGHALSYACAGEGEGAQELAACSKCGAYMTLGGRSGVKPRLKERCPGDKTDEGGRDQRSLWQRGFHPGARRQEGSRTARHRAKGEGIPALRSQGPVPEHAQERCLEWLGVAAEPAADSAATASSAGNAPAAAAEPQVAAGPGGAPEDAAATAAAASLPLRRPAAARAGRLGACGGSEEGPAAAAGPAGDAQVGRGPAPGMWGRCRAKPKADPVEVVDAAGPQATSRGRASVTFRVGESGDESPPERQPRSSGVQLRSSRHSARSNESVLSTLSPFQGIVAADDAEDRSDMPDFTGTWQCTRAEGNMPAFLLSMGLDPIMVEAARSAHYGVGHQVQVITQDGDNIHVVDQLKTTVTMMCQVGLGPQKSCDLEGRPVTITPTWDGQTLCVETTTQAGELFATSRRFFEGDVMVLELTSPSGAKMRRIFSKKAMSRPLMSMCSTVSTRLTAGTTSSS